MAKITKVERPNGVNVIQAKTKDEKRKEGQGYKWWLADSKAQLRDEIQRIVERLLEHRVRLHAATSLCSARILIHKKQFDQGSGLVLSLKNSSGEEGWTSNLGRHSWQGKAMADPAEP